jgi:DNA-binding transcriptional MerR regulator/methylmalonyl-CoA mutase cobalamin-binding subunit
MNSTDTVPRHPIRVVAQRTGLTPATIRAWERRYSAVEPARSDGGQRLYSDRDVGRLAMLRELTEVGRSISLVAVLSDEAARALLQEDRAASTPSGSAGAAGSDPREVVERSFARVVGLDAEGLERTLWRAAMSLDGQSFLDDVVGPLLVRIGAGWESGEINPGQEHMGSDVIDKVLGRVADPSRASDGPSLVVATLPGERHGLGARLVAAAATVDGWSVTYLGTDLPVDDIASAARSVGALAVAISVVGRDRVEETLRALESLRTALPTSIDLLVGGSGAASIEAHRLPERVRFVDGLEGFRGLPRSGRR